jgi:hypothetical protein
MKPLIQGNEDIDLPDKMSHSIVDISDHEKIDELRGPQN